MIQLKIQPKDVRGFNYHPSYSTTSYDTWRYFDLSAWEKELANGKEKFPKFNTVRIWLSWNAYCRDEKGFIENIRSVMDVCRKLDLYVIPCLFNRWHDPMVDCDGVYIDHFLPQSSWLLKFGDPFVSYIEALAENFKDEEQILVWDICNEPLAYLKKDVFECEDIVQKYELEWLARMARLLREGGISQPIGLGTTGREPMAIYDDFIDVYLTHMYYGGGDTTGFVNKVTRFLEEAKKNDKPLIVSETCWGSTDDKTRGDIIKGTLEILTKYEVGYIAHALQYCGVADLHDQCDGRLTVNIRHPHYILEDGSISPSANIGNLCFIMKDGSMRPYHEVFNDF